LEHYHWVDLTTPFLAQAGTTYWLSVQATMPFPPQWGWAGGTGGDGIAYQDFLGSRSQLPTDLAFRLTTPEPSILALIGIGLAGIGFQRRRCSA